MPEVVDFVLKVLGSNAEGGEIVMKVVEVVLKVAEVVLKVTFVPQGSLGKLRAAAGVQTWKHGGMELW